MGSINALCNSLFGMVWRPFVALSPWVGLTLLSVVVGVLALVCFKYCSNQKRIAEVKDKYKGHLLAIRLYRDDIVIVMRSLGRTLRYVLAYLGHNLRPMLVLLVPMMLLFAQMQMHLAYRPLEVGEKFKVEVRLKGDVEPAQAMNLELDLPEGLSLVHRVRIPEQRRAIYELTSTRRVDGDLRLRLASETATKSCVIADQEGPLVALAQLRGSSLADLFMFPTEPGFPKDSSFAQVSFHYPVRPLTLLGFDWSFGAEWGMGVLFLVISMVAAFLLKGLFGVTF